MITIDVTLLILLNALFSKWPCDSSLLLALLSRDLLDLTAPDLLVITMLLDGVLSDHVMLAVLSDPIMGPFHAHFAPIGL